MAMAGDGEHAGLEVELLQHGSHLRRALAGGGVAQSGGVVECRASAVVMGGGVVECGSVVLESAGGAAAGLLDAVGGVVIAGGREVEVEEGEGSREGLDVLRGSHLCIDNDGGGGIAIGVTSPQLLHAGMLEHLARGHPGAAEHLFPVDGNQSPERRGEGGDGYGGRLLQRLGSLVDMGGDLVQDGVGA
eukprot:TRINITY_DN1116_c0_g1_i1.p2 TRINITY_DN1116_c0_g1~~TRINITY_DN1116_c0_g1_i1.p2  ORF type:complete len:189 (-),score=15.13 TRINITY_DN1116_c0_g1_i1:1098-1664(-)